MATNRKIVFTISIGTCLLLGLGSSAFFNVSIKDWYDYLNQPSFAPSKFVFGPVWFILYTLLGISVGIIYSTKSKNIIKRRAIIFFIWQFLLNISWPFLFFGLKCIELSLYLLLFLSIESLFLMIYFARINKTAGTLILPYFLWLCFASLLNYSIYLLN